MGLFSGSFLLVFSSIFVLIVYREISTNLPMPETTGFPETLAKTVKRLRYKVDEQSSAYFICKPKHPVARLFEFSKLHAAKLLDGGVDLIGPRHGRQQSTKAAAGGIRLMIIRSRDRDRSGDINAPLRSRLRKQLP